jgi:prophage regulatory protein
MKNIIEQVRAIRTQQVIQTTGLGRTTIFRAVKEGRFPKPIKLSERAIGWLESDVRAWLESRRVA